MKIALAAAMAAASLAVSFSPASATVGHEIHHDTAAVGHAIHRAVHPRHKVCVMRHHHRVCSYR